MALGKAGSPQTKDLQAQNLIPDYFEVVSWLNDVLFCILQAENVSTEVPLGRSIAIKSRVLE